MSLFESSLFFFVSTTDIEERVWKKKSKKETDTHLFIFPPPFFSFGITAQVEHYDAHAEPPFQTDTSVLFSGEPPLVILKTKRSGTPTFS